MYQHEVGVKSSSFFIYIYIIYKIEREISKHFTKVGLCPPHFTNGEAGAWKGSDMASSAGEPGLRLA